ncbi:MAG: serine/threonine protein kinase [Oscillospiraceae bacterium]|nr:serine/threonine protein kinase [Oscillospiraceae bacterium]
MYDEFLRLIRENFDEEKELKSSLTGGIWRLRHKKSGKSYIFRRYEGSGEVYRKLLGIACPNLPKILDVAEKDGRVAVLEEYVSGDRLDFLLEGGPLSPREARSIARQLCRALYVLHSLDAVHRDVKPENVLLRGDEAVLIDFDASRVVKQDQRTDTVVLGTTGFAAPEQYGISQTDGRADIYSLGVLLNIMLTGKHPSRELAPGRLGRIVQRCTQINPKKRYKSVLYLMEDLE